MEKHKSDRTQEVNANSYRSPIININNIKINLRKEPTKEKIPKEKQLSNKGMIRLSIEVSLKCIYHR